MSQSTPLKQTVQLLLIFTILFIVGCASLNQQIPEDEQSQNAPNEPDEHQLMHEHCEMMPEMPGCEAFTDHDASEEHEENMHSGMMTTLIVEDA